MDKKIALDYILGQGKRVTAKVVSIDLDAPISTTTELLERMSAQGLLERDRDQRPREYAITEEGRKRLEFFKARDAAETPPGKHNPNGNSGASAAAAAPSNPGPDGAALGAKLDGLKDEVCSRLDAVREDMRDLLDVLAANRSSDAPAPTGSPASRVKELLARADRLTQGEGKSREKPEPEILDLYQAREKLDSLPAGWLRALPEKGALKDRIEKLQEELGWQLSQCVERCLELESQGSDLTPEEGKEMAHLRAALGVGSHAPALAEVVA